MRFSHGRTHQPCLSDMPPRPKILNLLAGIFVRGATPDKQIKYGDSFRLKYFIDNKPISRRDDVNFTCVRCNKKSKRIARYYFEDKMCLCSKCIREENYIKNESNVFIQIFSSNKTYISSDIHCSTFLFLSKCLIFFFYLWFNF